MPERFQLQLWDNAAKLLTDYLPYASGLKEEIELNRTHTLRFTYPASDDRTSRLVFRNIVRLVDTEKTDHLTGVVSVVSVANRQITVADVSGFSVGDYVLIFDSATKPTKSFVAKITAISSDQLTLSRMDFTPTEGPAEAITYADIVGQPYANIVGQAYSNVAGGLLTSSGSPIIKWNGTTFRIWNRSEARTEDGVHVHSVVCQHLSYELNERRFIQDARTGSAFALTSAQSVTDKQLNPQQIVDEIVKSEPRHYTDFRNGWLRGTVSSFLTDRISTAFGAGVLSVSTTSRTVTGTATSFLTVARQGSRLYTASGQTLQGIVDYVVSNTELILQNFPFYTITSGVIETDPDTRTYQFDTSGSLRAALLQVPEIWTDDTQSVQLAFGEDKTIDITSVPIPNTNDPTSGAEFRVGKNLQASSRKQDVAEFGNAIFPTGATSNWVGAQTGQMFEIGADPSTIPFHRNTRDKFLLNTRTEINQLRWGDPMTVLHAPVDAVVKKYISNREIVVELKANIPENLTAVASAGGSVPDATYYFRVSAVFATGETPASGQAGVTVSGLGGGGRIYLSWSAVTDAVAYRVYGVQGDGGEYYKETPALNWVLTDGVTATPSVSATSTGENYFTSRGSPHDFPGTSYINGMLLVRSSDVVDNEFDAKTGIGQLRAIESMTKVGTQSNLIYRVRVTHPFEVIPTNNWRVVMSPPQNVFMTPIRGFGNFEKLISSGGASEYDAETPFPTLGARFAGRIVDTDIGYAVADPGDFDAFKDHYADGLIQVRDSRDSGSSLSEDGKFTGQFGAVRSNTTGNKTDAHVSDSEFDIRFTGLGTTDGGSLRYEMMGPSQIVREYKDTEWDITVTKVPGALSGLILKIAGKIIYESSATTTYEAAVSTLRFVKDDGTATTGDLTDITVGDEVWADDSGTEKLIANVSFVDFANKEVYVDGGWIQGDEWGGGAADADPPPNDTIFYIRKPRPEFHHETNEGNVLSLTPHRNPDGAASGIADNVGFAYIIDAEVSEDGGVVYADWGSGADGSLKEGIGHVLRISSSPVYTTSTPLDVNELLLEHTNTYDATYTDINIKWIVLTRTNLYTWVSTEQAPWKYQRGDIGVLLLAETGGPLTIGKGIQKSTYVQGLTAITTEDAFDYGGLSKRSVPIPAGHHVRFEVDGRIFIGAKTVDSAIQFALRRGDQRLGQVREIESIVVGADDSPTRPFDLLKLTSDLDVIPQPGDRVEMLTVQDSASIATYGRVERQNAHGEISDPNELYRKSRAALRIHKDPVPRYEMSVLDMEFYNPDSRYEWENVALGETVRIVDDDFSVDDTSFMAIKVVRDYENPLNTKYTFDNHIKTLMRGSLLSTEVRLRQLETSARTSESQIDAPRCMFFDATSRRCSKRTPPNVFCNSTDSNHDGRLRKDKSRITKHDCRSYTPVDSSLFRYLPQIHVEDFTLPMGTTSITIEVDVPVLPNADPDGNTHSDIERFPKPRVFLGDAYYLDIYLVGQYVSPSDLVVALVKDDDGEFTPKDLIYQTGLTVTVTRIGAETPTDEIKGTIIVIVPGARA